MLCVQLVSYFKGALCCGWCFCTSTLITKPDDDVDYEDDDYVDDDDIDQDEDVDYGVDHENDYDDHDHRSS